MSRQVFGQVSRQVGFDGVQWRGLSGMRLVALEKAAWPALFTDTYLPAVRMAGGLIVSVCHHALEWVA